ncbi:hypothetical protein ACOMHN_015771 [Nucella lapillus]
MADFLRVKSKLLQAALPVTSHETSVENVVVVDLILELQASQDIHLVFCCNCKIEIEKRSGNTQYLVKGYWTWVKGLPFTTDQATII